MPRSGSFSCFKDIPSKLKEMLVSDFYPGLNPASAYERSDDGASKCLFITEDGRKFETVHIPDKNRSTICVSSQSGCRMGCPFCQTGKYGFHGNLTASEIINQVLSFPVESQVSHVVFMGMGEPMDNLENVLKACRILTAQWGASISPGNVTVSSVGIKPGIERFLSESECNLTVSLFSPFFEERRRIVPVENRYPALEIIEMMKSFPVKKKRRLTLSYVMIKGLNDSDTHLEELKKILKTSGIRINLLPYHRIYGDHSESSSAERMQYFRHNLVISGISASIRKSRGSDISAACGLLASDLKG
jgi:23S rRNA (adenine2503-C2)-methyltransferase